MLCLLRHALNRLEQCLGCCAAQFNNNGCENCPFLMMAGDSQRVAETTTISYHGMVAVLDPTASWAAKWLHVGAPGALLTSAQLLPSSRARSLACCCCAGMQTV